VYWIRFQQNTHQFLEVFDFALRFFCHFSSNNSSTVPASQPPFLLQKLNQSKMDTASLSQNGELVANGVALSHPQLNGISLTNGHSEQKDGGLKNGFHHPLMNGGYSNRLRNAYLNGNTNGELTNGNVAHLHNGHSKGNLMMICVDSFLTK
jgi:hypothetical protein